MLMGNSRSPDYNKASRFPATILHLLLESTQCQYLKPLLYTIFYAVSTYKKCGEYKL